MTARPNFSHRESDDGYQPVVAVLAERWRVIECRDGIQWIVQYLASSKTARRTEWKGVRYARTRAGLIASCDRSVPEIGPSALASLQALPERI